MVSPCHLPWYICYAFVFMPLPASPCLRLLRLSFSAVMLVVLWWTVWSWVLTIMKTLLLWIVRARLYGLPFYLSSALTKDLFYTFSFFFLLSSFHIWDKSNRFDTAFFSCHFLSPVTFTSLFIIFYYIYLKVKLNSSVRQELRKIVL